MSRRCFETGKRRHASKEAAGLFAETQARQRGTAALNPYICPHCRFWHLTRQRGARNKLTSFLESLEP